MLLLNWDFIANAYSNQYAFVFWCKPNFRLTQIFRKDCVVIPIFVIQYSLR